MIIPGTSKEIIEEAIQSGSFSITDIAKSTKLSRKTIYSVLRGDNHSEETKYHLLMFHVARHAHAA